MYKMIVCDLDETLLNNDKKIDDATALAIKQAIAQGVYFVPNTGRSFTSIQNVLTRLGMAHVPDTYTISYNGGITVENGNNHILAAHPLDFATVDQIFQIGVAANVCIHVYAEDRVYIYHINSGETDYLTGRIDGWTMIDEPNIHFLEKEPLIKILFQADEMTERQRLAKVVQDQVASPLAVTYSSDHYVEFNKAGVNKGAASLTLGEKLGIKPAEIIAVGDNSNDIPMLKAAGLGVSVANGTDEAKAASNFITQADNDHDPLAEIIHKFILA